MTRRFLSIMTLLMTLMPAVSMAQGAGKADGVKPEDRPVDMDNPTFVPMVKVSKVLVVGDSLQYV